jgi:hypothetical protein
MKGQEIDMIILKVTQTDAGPALLLSEEAQQVLGVGAEGEVGLVISESGEVTIAAQDMSPEARRERGRAFIRRYQQTFEALANPL